jgi:hypothetical protein
LATANLKGCLRINKYMKKTLLLSLFILSSYCTFGKAVAISTLQAVGSNFLISNGIAGVKSSSDLSLAYTGMGSYNGLAVTAIYVFIVNTGKGWVMVAADDRVKPVLAFSGESTFDANNIAPGTTEWIQNYETRIAAAIQNITVAQPEIANEWASLATGSGTRTARTTSGVEPLLATTWNQSPNYNALCPYDTTQLQNTVTGCVATAMAQVMKYWNWPPVGCGFHSYLDTPYGIQSANFGTTAYQWSSMPDVITGPNAAIATLMYHAGVSVNMQYGVGGSGALCNTRQSFITPCDEFALKANFHYKRSLHSLYRSGTVPGNIMGSGPDSIAEATWINDLQADLDAGHPILYVGYNLANGEGHNWVCDGYTADNYFHFNWGWDGSSNGYYTVDDLLPATAGFNLNYNQVALVGIEPDSFPSDPGYIQLASWLNTSNTPAEYGQPFSVSTSIYNAGINVFNGDFCARVFDTAGNPEGIMQTIMGQTVTPGGSTSTLTFSSAGMYNLQTGIYSLRILYRNSGDTAWTPVANNGNYINYTNVAFYNDTNIEIVEPLSFSTGYELYQSQPVSIKVILANWAFETIDNNQPYWPSNSFIGNIQATLNSTTDGSLVYTIAQLKGQVIDTNTIDTFTFSNSSLAVYPGTYLLEIQHQYNGTGNYYLTGSTFECNPLLVSVAYPTSAPLLSNTGEISIYPNPANTELNIAATDKINQLAITNLLGQTVFTQHYNDEKVSVNVSGLPPGVYFVKVNGSEVRKFVKE